MFFSQEPIFTSAKRGSRTVNIKVADTVQQCTVMLGGNLAGGKLPPFIMFKGGIIRTIYRYSTGVCTLCRSLYSSSRTIRMNLKSCTWKYFK
jgi:hypothetical protein